MGKYTVLRDPKVDRLVQSHHDVAINEIEKIPGVLSIVLVGGFGRGEGSILLEKGKIIPLNDYDIYIISKKLVDEERLNKTAGKIEEVVGSSGFSLYDSSTRDFYFDLRCIPLNKLPSLPPFIKYYEMKHASMVIWGEDFRHLIPKYSPSELPVSEGIRFVLNRLSSIFLWNPFMPTRLSRKWKFWEIRGFFYDIPKLYIECCTLLCQFGGIYAPTYRQRLSKLKKIFKSQYKSLDNVSPGLMERINKYTRMKLDPKFPKGPNYLDIWLNARNDALNVLDLVLTKRFNLGLHDIGGVRFAYRYFLPYIKARLKKYRLETYLPLRLMGFLLSQLFLRLTWTKRLWKLNKFSIRPLFGWLDPGLTIFQSLVFLTQSLEDSYFITDSKLRLAASNLSKVHPARYSEDTYRQYLYLYEDYVSAWKKYFFMKLSTV